jgi:transposase
MKRWVWFKLRKEFAISRFSLTDAQWERTEPFCLGKPTAADRTGSDNRLFRGGVTGCPHRQFLAGSAGVVWRVAKMAKGYFSGNTVFKRSMRGDKTNTSFGAMIHLASAVINSRQPIPNRP